ncbi:MAG: virulence protein RhuM/Fic/DOC family protein [Candidatus Paceibacterota bacterium]
MNTKPHTIIYQAKNGAIELKGDWTQDTIWASQAQIADLFQVDQSVVSRHINNIFKDYEVDKESNMQKMHIANSDKPVNLYSLDVILGVGYRTNSKVAIEFRKWATQTLKQYITKGYSINKKVLAQNYDEFLKAIETVKTLIPVNSEVKTGDALELVKFFAETWFALDAYDKSDLPQSGLNKSEVEFNADELIQALVDLKQDLYKKKMATELFGQEKQPNAIAGIVGNIFQSAFGEEIYPSIEEKAAHLLYFIIKNHPLNDGNKRSGAFAFIWLLNKTKTLNTSKITPQVLTTLTLLVAESDPHNKDQIIGLILQILK